MKLTCLSTSSFLFELEKNISPCNKREIRIRIVGLSKSSVAFTIAFTLATAHNLHIAAQPPQKGERGLAGLNLN